MKGINHLVLTGRDLEALRSNYQALGFTVTPRGQHPFGTGNSIIQLHGTYLELLSVTIPQDVPEHRAGNFSFCRIQPRLPLETRGLLDDGARYLGCARRYSGLACSWSANLRSVRFFENGQDARRRRCEGGILPRVCEPSVAPWLGLFACQHYRPEYYEQPQYLKHPNGASTVRDVWIVGETVLDLANYIRTVTGANTLSEGPDAVAIQTRTGTIVLARPQAFEAAFGVAPPHPEDGPHLAGFTVACSPLGQLAELPLTKTGNRHVLAPAKNFGTAISFVEMARSQ
jgi:hypothetical protein